MNLVDLAKSLGSFFSRATYIPKNRMPNLRDPALNVYFGVPTSTAGIAVTEDTALTYSPVFQAIRIISETVASLPLHVYRRTPTGRLRVDEMGVSDLLRFQPNDECTAMQFRESILAHALSWGNGYAEIERDSFGRPLRLWLLQPNTVVVERDEFGQLQYSYRLPGQRAVNLHSMDVLHIAGPGFDGITGYSVVKMARESIGLGMACEQFGAGLFGSGARPSGMLEHPGRLSDDARGRLRGDWERLHAGIDNAHRVAILEEGMKWTATSIPPDDAQFLQTRKFQIEEVARWFNIPPSKLRDTGGVSYSSLEQENIAFLSETLRPWLIRLEQEFRRKLLLPESSELYCEHSVEGLLRTDLSARYAAYAVGRNWGWLSVNEIRSLENLEPVAGGDVYLQPLNMQPLDSAGGAQAPAAAPTVGASPGSVVEEPVAEPVAESEPETNQGNFASAATVKLAEDMTLHQVSHCEHGYTNRCRICGIERERELIPPTEPGGQHGWRLKWKPILSVDTGTSGAERSASQKVLVLMRGVPSSGKTYRAIELAKGNTELIFSADQFFGSSVQEYSANFNVELLSAAHKSCQGKVAEALKAGLPLAIVDNTNLTAKECLPYFTMAVANGYAVRIAEPTSSWWVEDILPYLGDKEKNRVHLERMAVVLAKKSLQTHKVPVATIKRMLWKYELDLTVERLASFLVSV
jgi:HK97 family phage portal protein